MHLIHASLIAGLAGIVLTGGLSSVESGYSPRVLGELGPCAADYQTASSVTYEAFHWIEAITPRRKFASAWSAPCLGAEKKPTRSGINQVDPEIESAWTFEGDNEDWTPVIRRFN